MNRILIISAHPDDEILGCGGIMSKFRDKSTFKILFIGEGSTCRFQSPSLPEAKEEIIIRNRFAEKALNHLEIKEFSFNNLPCGRFDIIPLIEINKIIENEINDFKPDTVFTHSDADSNKDHVKVNESTIIATRPGCGVKNVYSYEVLSSTEWGFKKLFKPNVFFSLSKRNIDEKCEALEFYKSEIKDYPFPRSTEGIYTLAQRRGMQSGNNYAEAFELVRQFNS